MYRLTNEEMAEMFVKAYDKGNVYNLKDCARCDDKCGSCPAANACTQLATNAFEDFKYYYDKDILPILEEDYYEYL